MKRGGKQLWSLMTNILFETYCDLPTYQLTLKGYQALSEELPIKVRAKYSRYIKKEDFVWCDILYIVRGDNPASKYLAKKAKAFGKKVLVGLDDDLLEYTSAQHPWVEHRRKASLRYILSVSDVMITTNKYLAEKYKLLYGVKYALTDTVVNSIDFDSETDVGKTVNIIYAANAGHKIFFDKFITPILTKFAHKYKGSLSLTAIGPDLDFEQLPVPTLKLGPLPFAEYQSFMSTHHFDIGLAPLFDNDVCRSKYFNKYLEYSIHNICGVYSNVPPYSYVIQNNVNGLLVDNSPEEWYNALCTLMDDAQLRRSCICNSRNHIIARFSSTAVANRLIEQIPYMTSFKASSVSNIRLRPMFLFFLSLEIINRFLNLFRK